MEYVITFLFLIILTLVIVTLVSYKYITNKKRNLDIKMNNTELCYNYVINDENKFRYKADFNYLKQCDVVIIENLTTFKRFICDKDVFNFIFEEIKAEENVKTLSIDRKYAGCYRVRHSNDRFALTRITVKDYKKVIITVTNQSNNRSYNLSEFIFPALFKEIQVESSDSQ